ncbi:MAG: integrase arm-type DNA-binding domain-containing protein [Pseudomonadota bacterium]
MARAVSQLTDIEVKAFAKTPGDKIRSHHDGAGLYFVVDGRRAGPDEAGSASWVYRYMFEGKARMLGLGPYPAIGLKDARKRAADARQLRAYGRDPLAVKDADRAARRADTARAVTFKVVAEEFISAHRVQWKNAKHADQWTSTLKTYVYPLIGDQVVGDIDADAVLKVLRQDVRGEGRAVVALWEAKPETASRLRGRIETVLDYARVRGLREGDNPAIWRGNLKLALPARRKVRAVKHHEALPFKEAAKFMTALRTQDGMAAKALEFAILTAARTGEVLGAAWGEIDLDDARWAIPGGRMKAGRPHGVPLSAAAVEILRALKPDNAPTNALVFPGAKPGKPLSNMAFLMLLRRMGKADLTTHGFRSTFRDWVSAETNFPSELAERALAHAVADATEASYFRGDLFDKRRALMDSWALYCAAAAGGNVSPMRKADAA